MNVWIKGLLDLFYPAAKAPAALPWIEEPFCRRCGQPHHGLIRAAFVCSNCRGRQWTLEEARATLRYEGYVREVILQLKYERRFHHLPMLVDWLERGYRSYFSLKKFDILVPVPLHSSRRRSRGFNQAHEMARMLGRRVNLPVWPCLKRVRDTPTQTQLVRYQRLNNPEGAFGVKRWFDLRHKRVLLIDDVLTTGATADACARALKRRRASETVVLTVARG